MWLATALRLSVSEDFASVRSLGSKRHALYKGAYMIGSSEKSFVLSSEARSMRAGIVRVQRVYQTSYFN